MRQRGDPSNLKLCQRGEWQDRMLVETVLSMLTLVCHLKKVMHRGWAYFQARLAFTMAAFNVLVQWHGFQPYASGFAHSTELRGRAPTPFVIPLQLVSLTPILGHRLQRLLDLRVTHAKHRSPDPRKPDHHRRFSQRSHLLSAPWRRQGVSRMRRGFPPGLGLSTRPQGALSWRWVPDASLPLRPCPPRWAHHLAGPVHHMPSGVHGLAPLRPPLSPHATCGSPRCLVGYPRGPQFGAVRRDPSYLAHGALPSHLCAGAAQFGHRAHPVWPAPAHLYLADEKHSRCLTEKVYLPTIVSGRVLWHLGYTEEASAAAFTESYGAFQRAASQQEPSYQVKGLLIDGFDCTAKSLRTLFPRARLAPASAMRSSSSLRN